MANKSWYVSFQVRQREKREPARAAETFPNERAAKKFASAKLAETQYVTAGTLNPHLPNERSPQRRCLNGSKNQITIWPEPEPHLLFIWLIAALAIIWNLLGAR
jgi:hypothetical protein